MFVVADNDTNVDVANAGVFVIAVAFTYADVLVAEAVVEVIAVVGYVLSLLLLNLLK